MMIAMIADKGLSTSIETRKNSFRTELQLLHYDLHRLENESTCNIGKFLEHQRCFNGAIYCNMRMSIFIVSSKAEGETK